MTAEAGAVIVYPNSVGVQYFDALAAALFLLSGTAACVAGAVLYVDGGYGPMWRPGKF